VPSFFDFFSKEKKPNLEVAIQDIESWIHSQSSKIFDDAKIQGNLVMKNLETSASDVKSAADEFLKAEINTGELDQPLIPTIRNSRNSIANKIINIISKLEFPEAKNFNDLTNNTRQISQSLAQIDQTLKTHGRVLFTILNKEIRPLLTGLKKMQQEAAQLSKIIEKNSDKANEVEQILTIATRLLTLNSELLDDLSFMKKAKKGSADFVKNEDEIIKQLDEAKHSEEYQDSQRIKEEAQELSLKLSNLEAEFDTLFSKLRKPLEKYGYVVNLKKEENNLIQTYLESPSKGLLNDKNIIIATMLERLKDFINREKISIKNPEKALNRIDDIQPVLKSKRDMMKKISEDYESILSSQSKSAITRVNSIQQILDEKKGVIADQKIFIEKTEINIHEINKHIEDLRSKLEESASDIFKVQLRIIGLASFQD